MHIKELIIDGFKSYANRTVISGFDSAFNAITGRNGTGKSNVLDSICFVLGISKLSQVRVDKMTELIYKNGQAGITKASVTIVFDNNDPKTSPVGYEAVQELSVTRQIVMGGRNKYMVNGRVMKQKQVQDLFGSVQLDVNNPHFLIMQGRIVRMMNMKPRETLSMVEEASGTRMYESKKQVSLQIIEKKDAKLKEINSIITEEINPSLDKLQKDRAQYRQYTKNVANIERLERQQIAHIYFANKITVHKQESAEQALQKKINTATQSHEQALADLQEKEAELQELTKRKEDEMTGDFKQLQKQADVASKVLVQQNSKWQNEKQNLKAEKGRLSKAQAALDANVKAIEKQQTALEIANTKIAGADNERVAIKKRVEDLQTELQCLSAGMMTQGPGQQDSLSEELVKCNTALAKANSTAKQSSMRLKGVFAELKTTKGKLKKAKNTSGATEQKLQSVRSDFEKVSTQREKMDYSPEREEELQNEIAQKEEKCTRLADKQRQLRHHLKRIEVSYDQPSKNFDHNKVKGLIANLTQVKDPAAIQALEVAAGSKLRQLVVDDKRTASALLKKGNLKRRVTIVPLDSVSARCLTDQHVATAKKLVGADNVDAAIDLVKFDPELRPAMEHAFGSTFICKDGNTAKQVTFNKSIRKRSVSYEGDVFNPSGTMSGGSRSSKHSLLVAINKLQRITDLLEVESKSLNELKAELHALQAIGKKYYAVNKKFELLQHSLEMLQAQVSKSQFGALQVKVGELEKACEDYKESEKNAKARSEELQTRIKKIQAQLDDFEAAQKTMMVNKEAEIKKAKKSMSSFEATHRKLHKNLKTMEVECTSLAEEQDDLKSQCQAFETECEKIQSNLAKLEALVQDARADFDKANDQVEEKRSALQECDSALKSIVKEKTRLNRCVTAATGQVKKLQHKMKTLREDGAAASQVVASLFKAHQWIANEEEFFGKSGTDYDFEADSFDSKMLKSEISKLKAQQNVIARNVNHKVMGMIEKVEQDYLDLKKKKDIIIADRTKIMKTIQELDQRKKKALETAYKKVNRDFGDIFSTLLPGSSAKLAPVDGKSIHGGLVPMVAFSGKWKESLMELSGGQRSLLALSLVLAMLLFKPAPMYILDEVDAALDLSHTQNIGRLLKTHFSQSQFVVVSLKEGMFDNANVVFTTQNTDGVSSVQRTATLNGINKNRRQGGANKKVVKRANNTKRSRLANVSNQ